MKKKQYIRPQVDLIIPCKVTGLLAGTIIDTAHPDEPMAKKNYWDTVDEGSDSLYDFRRVGNSMNKLWDD
jgi:subtilisin family serine protease